MPMSHSLVTTPTIIEDCQFGEFGRTVTIKTKGAEHLKQINRDSMPAAVLYDSIPESKMFPSYRFHGFSEKDLMEQITTKYTEDFGGGYGIGVGYAKPESYSYTAGFVQQSPLGWLESFRHDQWGEQIAAKHTEDFGGGYGIGVVYAKPGPYSYTAGFVQQSPLGWLESFRHDQWGGQIKGAVTSLLESGDAEEEVAPEAVEYACQLIDQLPSECLLLPPPDVSGFADKKAVYFEWLLESDGRMLLTVEPDGTVAYVCTFGNARSRNLGAWEDGIVDLMRPCFVKLVQLREKDLNAWDASRTAHLSPDLLSKEDIR